MKYIEALIKFLDERPRTVFIVLSVLFGAGLTYQTIAVQDLSLEVGGLRVQTQMMHNIITERCQ